MKEIILTQEKVALVDDEDFKWLNNWKWVASKHRNTYYAFRSFMYNDKRIYVYMHREILGIINKKTISDHIDRNGLNNQRDNLRKATYSENACNKCVTKNGTSRFKGVSFSTSKQKWRAQIFKDGVFKHIGYFNDETDAAKAYNNVAETVHGNFSYINIF